MKEYNLEINDWLMGIYSEYGKQINKNIGNILKEDGGSGWPKEPPNYIAFRYDGKLQSIHHIEGYNVLTKPHSVIPEMPDREWDDPHFIYNLGPAIIASKEIYR